MTFCDYCNCNDCKNGIKGLFHAATKDGDWICEICYEYDLCASAKCDPCSGACATNECGHRPQIISKWIEGK